MEAISFCRFHSHTEQKHIILLKYYRIDKHTACIDTRRLIQPKMTSPKYNMQSQRLERVQKRTLERQTTQEERDGEGGRASEKRRLNP